MCVYTEVDSLAGMAQQAGIPEDTFRQYYPHYVETVHKVMAMLRDLLKMTEGTQRELVSATLNFYKTIEDIGLLKLQ